MHMNTLLSGFTVSIRITNKNSGNISQNRALRIVSQVIIQRLSSHKQTRWSLLDLHHLSQRKMMVMKEMVLPEEGQAVEMEEVHHQMEVDKDHQEDKAAIGEVMAKVHHAVMTTEEAAIEEMMIKKNIMPGSTCSMVKKIQAKKPTGNPDMIKTASSKHPIEFSKS